ncbi:MAG: alpha/beta fold hydrolase [Lentisphaeria bacterium]|nr:alpha/beta fold hydrolase [Lentisphaeria bacterium]
MKKRSGVFCLIISALLLLLCGCHHPAAEYPEEHSGAWTPSEIENVLGGHDPMEKFNRPVFACTDFLMNYVADPLGRVYTSIFPRPFIKHFDNVCVNLEYPARLISSLLQAEWQAAGTETLRFLANTTLGILGIFDVAQAWWYIPPAEADFGQAFATWGIGPGHTLMLPIVPAVNGRDMIGKLFDTAFDLKTYIPYAGYATFLNRMVVAQQGYDQVVSGALDPYKNFRQLMLVRRELQLKMYFYKEAQRQIAEFKARAGQPELPPAEILPLAQPEWLQGKYLRLSRYFSQDNVTDSMRSVMFRAQKDDDFWYMPLSVFNSDFIRQAYVRTVELIPERPGMYYAFWKAPEVPENAPVPPEKLAILLPGIGGNCTTGMLTALAEKFHGAGYAVLGTDSTFNWRFLQADGQGLPGYLPDDAKRIRSALTAILEDLKRREWINAPEIVVCGYSMGGLQSLKLAEMEEREPQLNAVRYIAINPPVSTEYALRQIDQLINVSAKWSKSEMLTRLYDNAGRMFINLSRRYQHFDPAAEAVKPWSYQVPLDKDTARYIVGLSLKLSMRELLLAQHMETPLENFPEYAWNKRNELYMEIDRVTFAGYAEKLLHPRYPGKSMAELLAASDLHSLEKTLKNSSKVRVLHTLDDFLVSEKDRKFLDSALKDRISWFSNGGHLGSLYYRSASDAVVNAASY